MKLLDLLNLIILGFLLLINLLGHHYMTATAWFIALLWWYHGFHFINWYREALDDSFKLTDELIKIIEENEKEKNNPTSN